MPGMLPISAAHALLGVDPVTLRRWIAAAGTPIITDPVDRRRRWISLDDLVSLARLHHRYLPPASSISSDGAQFPGQCCAGCAQLARELAELRVLVEQLRDCRG